MSRPIQLPDCFKWWKNLPQQIDAVEWLNNQLTDEQRAEFGRRFRANPTAAIAIKDAPEIEEVPADVEQDVWLKMNWTGSYDPDGFRIFKLALYNNGNIVDQISVLSGAGVTQDEAFVRPEDDYSGSLRCLPEGIYNLGIVEDSRDEGAESWGEGIGRWAIALNVIDNHAVNNRSAFYIHDDSNRDYSKGSAGCICPFKADGMQRIIGWLEAKTKPSQMVCDLGTGFLKER
jgi:hypothetical protein